MSVSRLMTSFTRRLAIELIELTVFSQFLPALMGEIILLHAIIVNGATLTGHAFADPFSMVNALFAYESFGLVVIGLTLILYPVARLPRLLIARDKRWSVRRKAAITLSLTITGYMTLFGIFFASNRIGVPSIWITMLGLNIAALLYGYAVRYIANRVIRRLEQPDFYDVVKPVVPPTPSSIS